VSNISRGYIVLTCSKCGGIFDNEFITNLFSSLTAKEFGEKANIWRTDDQHAW